MPGRTGRRPLPTAIKLLSGETRPSRLRGRGLEPSPKVARPRRPSHLAGYAATEWDRLCRLLLPLRVLTVADAPILEATCSAYANMRDAEDAIQRDGAYQVSETKAGGQMTRQHPGLAVRAESWRRYVIGLSHFGLSPSSRTKVSAVGSPETSAERLAARFFPHPSRGAR